MVSSGLKNNLKNKFLSKAGRGVVKSPFFIIRRVEGVFNGRDRKILQGV